MHCPKRTWEEYGRIVGGIGSAIHLAGANVEVHATVHSSVFTITDNRFRDVLLEMLCSSDLQFMHVHIPLATSINLGGVLVCI